MVKKCFLLSCSCLFILLFNECAFADQVDRFLLDRVKLSANVENNSKVLKTTDTSTFSDNTNTENIYSLGAEYKISLFNFIYEDDSNKEMLKKSLADNFIFYAGATHGNSASELNDGQAVKIKTKDETAYKFGVKFEFNLSELKAGL